MRPGLGARRQSLLAITKDVGEFSESYDDAAEPVGVNMAGHDTYLLGPKTVMLDSFVIDLLNVDTGAQTFRLKLLVNMDWEDDGIIVPEMKAKRNLRSNHTENETSPAPSTFTRQNSDLNQGSHSRRSSDGSQGCQDVYKTGKYVLKQEFCDDPLSTTWNPEVVLVNAISDESPIEAGSKFHSVQILSGRPILSRSVLYQPECRCAFSFANFPFDETDLVVKFSSNKWNSEQVSFMWSHRLRTGNGIEFGTSSSLRKKVDQNAVGGVGLSEFEIINVRVECDEKEMNCMSRYDNAEGAFSEAHLIIHVRRDPYSYLLRVAAVVELLMFLEVLSFLTHDDDLSARFSISGTIFLAMVSLYGPMADSLPKVSVVTRGDKWHFQNFVLLFASNVENLLACLLRKYTNMQHNNFVESLLAIVYLYFVTRNLFWFIKPLKQREDFALLLDWFEARAELLKGKLRWFISTIRPWTKTSEDEVNIKLSAVVRAAQAANIMGHKTRSKSKEEAVCGAINVNTATDHNPNNNMRRFLEPAHDVAIVVPATTTTIVEPNRQRQLQGKTSTRQDTVVASKEDDVKTDPPLHTGKSIEDMELIVVERFDQETKSSSHTSILASSSMEGSAGEYPRRDDDNGADLDDASAVSERRRWGKVGALRKLARHRKMR